MKIHLRNCLAAAVLFALSSVLLLAADASGTWKGSFDFNGTAVGLTFNMKTDGPTVTGTVSVEGVQADPVEIKDGKVDGDAITFWCTTAYQGNTIKVLYKGKIDGNQIAFNMATDDGAFSADLVAKRGDSK